MLDKIVFDWQAGQTWYCVSVASVVVSHGYENHAFNPAVLSSVQDNPLFDLVLL